jgi:hypothetical protein
MSCRICRAVHNLAAFSSEEDYGVYYECRDRCIIHCSDCRRPIEYPKVYYPSYPTVIICPHCQCATRFVEPVHSTDQLIVAGRAPEVDHPHECNYCERLFGPENPPDSRLIAWVWRDYCAACILDCMACGAANHLRIIDIERSVLSCWACGYYSLDGYEYVRSSGDDRDSIFYGSPADAP